MPVNKLEHFLVRAADLAATKAFYETVLGLRDGDRPSFPFPGHWLYLGETPCVHLVGTSLDARRSAYLDDGDRTGADVGSGAVDHIGFWATDLDGMIERLDGLGVPARRVEVPGLVQLFVKDPNGITIELNFSDS